MTMLRKPRFVPTLLAATLMAVGLWAGLGAAPSAAEPARLEKVGLGPVCRLMQVDTVQFQPASRGTWSLYIAGLKDFSNMEVSLRNRVGPGGRWTLEVIGCTPNFIALPVRTPYWLSLPLSDLPNVTSVRVVGANGAWRPRLPR